MSDTKLQYYHTSYGEAFGYNDRQERYHQQRGTLSKSVTLTTRNIPALPLLQTSDVFRRDALGFRRALKTEADMNRTIFMTPYHEEPEVPAPPPTEWYKLHDPGRYNVRSRYNETNYITSRAQFTPHAYQAQKKVGSGGNLASPSQTQTQGMDTDPSIPTTDTSTNATTTTTLPRIPSPSKQQAMPVLVKGLPPVDRTGVPNNSMQGTHVWF